MVDPTQSSAPSSALERLGPRARRRAVPRLTIALAAGGCALVVLGALTVGGDGLGGDGGDPSQLPGLLASGAVVAGGFVLLSRFPSGPLATGGAVAVVFGIPLVLFFLTFDENTLPPYSTETILFGSTAAWAAAYAVGPARGRPLFLGAAGIGLWATLLQLTEGVFDFPFDAVNTFGVGFEDDRFGQSFRPDAPDPATVGLLSLLVAAGYLLLARRWDRQRFAGAATPLTAAALAIIPFGIGFLAGDLEAVGTGLLTSAIGIVVAAHGADVGRRATTWLGGAGAAIGVLIVVTDVVDEATPGGLLLMLLGAGAIAGAEALRRATNEPDELAGEGDPEPVSF